MDLGMGVRDGYGCGVEGTVGHVHSPHPAASGVTHPYKLVDCSVGWLVNRGYHVIGLCDESLYVVKWTLVVVSCDGNA